MRGDVERKNQYCLVTIGEKDKGNFVVGVSKDDLDRDASDVFSLAYKKYNKNNVVIVPLSEHDINLCEKFLNYSFIIKKMKKGDSEVFNGDDAGYKVITDDFNKEVLPIQVEGKDGCGLVSDLADEIIKKIGLIGQYPNDHSGGPNECDVVLKKERILLALNGDSNMSNGQIENAIKDLLKTHNKYAVLYYYLSLLANRGNDYDSAIYYLDQAINHSENKNILFFWEKGDLCLQHESLDCTAEAYGEALKLSAKNHDYAMGSYGRMALLSSVSGNREDVSSYVQKMHEIFTFTKKEYSSSIYQLMGRGQYEINGYGLNYYTARAYAKLGEYEEALKYINKASEFASGLGGDEEANVAYYKAFINDLYGKGDCSLWNDYLEQGRDLSIENQLMTKYAFSKKCH